MVVGLVAAMHDYIIIHDMYLTNQREYSRNHDACPFPTGSLFYQHHSDSEITGSSCIRFSLPALSIMLNHL